MRIHLLACHNYDFLVPTISILFICSCFSAPIDADFFFYILFCSEAPIWPEVPCPRAGRRRYGDTHATAAIRVFQEYRDFWFKTKEKKSRYGGGHGVDPAGYGDADSTAPSPIEAHATNPNIALSLTVRPHEDAQSFYSYLLKSRLNPVIPSIWCYFYAFHCWSWIQMMERL